MPGGQSPARLPEQSTQRFPRGLAQDARPRRGLPTCLRLEPTPAAVPLRATGKAPSGFSKLVFYISVVLGGLVWDGCFGHGSPWGDAVSDGKRFKTPPEKLLCGARTWSGGVLALPSFLLLSRNPGRFVYLWTEYLSLQHLESSDPPVPASPEGAGPPPEGLNAGQNSSGSCPSGWVGERTR